METNADRYWVRFSYVCPCCERKERIELRVELDAEIQIFDCIGCLGSIGVLTDHLERSLTEKTADNGALIIDKTIPVFEFEDTAEDQAGFAPGASDRGQLFIPGEFIFSPGSWENVFLN